jgi:dihydrofolate reductase
VADEDGNFDWAEPDEEVHAYVNDLERSVVLTPVIRDFAEIWRQADKVVYSKTLETASTSKTRIERDFDPDAVRRMKTSAERDIGVGSPNFASHAFKAGLVDECQLFVAPIVVGGGKPSLPDGVGLRLELMDQRRFGNDMVHLLYRTRA